MPHSYCIYDLWELWDTENDFIPMVSINIKKT